MNARNLGILLLGATAMGLLSGSSCDPDLLADPGFDLWCGDHELCAWEVRQGTVAPRDTWHRSDPGVELIGAPVVLTQLTDVDSSQAPCLGFELLVQAERTADLTLELDFLDDGTVDLVEPIPAGDWTPASFRITAPDWYDRVRFLVRKSGPGKAVLAEIRARATTGCRQPPLPLTARPVGAVCTSDDVCAALHCAPAAPDWLASEERSCSACLADEECPGAEACGLEVVPGETRTYFGCGAAGRHGLGRQCRGDGECGSGICCAGVCSGCCADRPCAGGQRCRPRTWSDLGDETYQLLQLPFQCDPGQGRGAADSVCLFDDDCASADCRGASATPQQLCTLDARPCAADADCPGSLFAACLPLGVTDGRCR